MLTRKPLIAALLGCSLGGVQPETETETETPSSDTVDSEEPTVETDTIQVDTVPVPVRVQDPTTGCWGEVIEQWPAAYWSGYAEPECQETDFDWYMTRDGLCYQVNASCPEWRNDPAVEACPGMDDPCCARSDNCP
jgi:hypothetical protein